MQCRTVAAVLRRIWISIRISRARAPKCWLAVLRCQKLALVFDAGQPRLNIIEFRSSDKIFVLCRQNLRNLFLRMLNAIRRLWMIGERLRYSARFLLLQVLYLLKEGYKRLRIITRAIHVLHAEKIGLRFKFARKHEKCHRDGDVDRFIDAVSGPGIAC